MNPFRTSVQVGSVLWASSILDILEVEFPAHTAIFEMRNPIQGNTIRITNLVFHSTDVDDSFKGIFGRKPEQLAPDLAGITHAFSIARLML
jgi:hypothetical protein